LDVDDLEVGSHCRPPRIQGTRTVGHTDPSSSPETDRQTTPIQIIPINLE